MIFIFLEASYRVVFDSKKKFKKSDQSHELNKTRSISQSLIREIVNTSKGFNPHNFLRQ